MNKKLIVMFAAEIIAVGVLRALHIIRRDRAMMPRSSKINKLKKKPVFRNPRITPSQEKVTRDLEEVELSHWTPKFVDGKIQNTPDSSPDAD